MRVPHTRSVRGKGTELRDHPCERKAECRGDLVLPASVPGDQQAFVGRVGFWRGVQVTPSDARAGEGGGWAQAPPSK
jgi:hypothetical protein